MTMNPYAAFLALALGGVPVRAQQSPPQPQHDLPRPIDNGQDLLNTGRMLFKLADENNDGQISQKEAVDAANLAVGGFFFRADKNGDGILSPQEAKDARDAFLVTKPWLRYVVETAQTNKPTASDTNSSNGNLVATLWATFDTNNDRQIQATELRKTVQTAVEGAFGSADTNRDGQLSPGELNAAMAGMTRQVAQAAFQQADTDHNGQISQAEFEKAIVEPSRVAFKILDLNHDNQISPQEAQTARQVVVSRVRSLWIPERSNSPQNQINRALANPVQPPAR